MKYACTFVILILFFSCNKKENKKKNEFLITNNSSQKIKKTESKSHIKGEVFGDPDDITPHLLIKKNYDLNGDCIIEQNFNLKNNEFRFKSNYQYNVDNKLIKTYDYLENGELDATVEVKYYLNNTKTYLTNSLGDTSLILEEYLDKNGNTTKSISYISGVLNSKSSYKYSSKGQIINQFYTKYNSRGGFAYEYGSEFSYDKNGNIIKDLSKEESTTYKYEYNEFKHWVKKTEFKNSIPYLITERKIKYYDKNELM